MDAMHGFETYLNWFIRLSTETIELSKADKSAAPLIDNNPGAAHRSGNFTIGTADARGRTRTVVKDYKEQTKKLAKAHVLLKPIE